MLSNKSKSFLFAIIISIIAGGCFLLWYGFSPLDVQRDTWLFYGYAESDNMQHYAGWLAFRNENWAFPLGKLNTISYPQGTQLSFMDSIPWVAIFFKLLSPVLPETFQYFGIYVLLCFILQFYVAFRIFKLYEENTVKIFLCASLFCLAPIFVERAFRHTALASHWIVLLSIYLFLRTKKFGHDRMDYLYLFLMVLSVGIHPYFLPIIFGLMIASMADLAFFSHKVKRAAALIVLSIPAIVIPSFLLGIFRLDGSSINLFQGYGVFSANLNCFFNPISTNIMKTGSSEVVYKWSSFLPQLPQINGNYDGFNYLGLGGLLALASALIFVVYKLLFDRNQLVSLCKKYIFLIASMFVFAAYAVSNVVTFNERQVTIPIPEFLQKICGIFAASGRIMYPVYYTVLIFSLVLICRVRMKTGAALNFVAIILILSVQLLDIKDMILLKHSYFSQFENSIHTNHPYDTEYDTKFWTYISQNYDNCWIIDAYRSIGYGLVEYCAKNGIRTNYITSNRFTNEEIESGKRFQDDILMFLRNGQLDKKTIYIITDPTLMDELKITLSNSAEYFYDDHYYGQFMIIVPNKGF